MSDPIARLNAALEGRYHIESELGEGGMATVYLANDLKHERKVALKVLKPELAAVVGAERFLAEIKTTANLQHPHILPLFDSGEADSFLFYVMPYVEGEDLRQKLDREHQLPVDDALRIATNMAEALDYAHRQGVVHRDIKPANVLLLDGKPVIADFGIALAVGVAGGGRLTETGLSIGTPFYMSPEQATGDQAVGPASDTFALACVLYEMLVGEPPYPGSTAQAVLGKIIQGIPVSATAIRQSVPANVDAAIRKALEKLPADRFTGARDFAQALSEPGFRHGEPPSSSGTGATTIWNPLSLATTASTVVLAAALGWGLLRPEPSRPVARFASPFSEGQAPIGALELMRDGSAGVYAGSSPTGSQLWVRDWNDLDARPIPGTEGVRVTLEGTSFALSPDGREVAFPIGDPGPLRVVPLAGGPSRTLADVAYNAAWSSDGWIYFTSSSFGIARVRATGGEIESLVEPSEGESLYALPHALPDGKAVMFQVWRSPNGSDAEIWLLDLESGERRVLTPGSSPSYAASGHLLFGTADGRLMAAPFDIIRGELTGDPVPIAEGLATAPTRGNLTYSVSDDGTLAYRVGGAGGAGHEFVWVNRSGQPTPVDPGHRFHLLPNYGLRLSPDETRIAFNSEVDGNDDVRIKHLPDGPEERITFSEDIDYRPFWTPDGQNVIYFSGPSSQDRNVWSRRADGTGDAVLMLDDERSLNQGSSSPDGKWLVFRASATSAMGLGLRDILAFRPGVDSTAVPLVASAEFAENQPALSPDARWLAYSSDETGRDEVFVRPFPNVDSTRVRISTDGGASPVWAKSGRELFFVDVDRTMITAQFDPATGRVMSQESLFTIPPAYPAVSGNNFYDVDREGERFLMMRPYADNNVQEDFSGFILVQNFFEDLKRLVPTN